MLFRSSKVSATAYLSPREVDKRGDLADYDVHPDLIDRLRSAVATLVTLRKGVIS